MSAAKSLDALRREIDRIDNEIHDLLMRRTQVVEKVRDVKKGQRIKIRPAREDEILYRLVARHSGNFPKRELTRIWREIIVATLSFEGPFSMAVFADENNSGCRDLGRDMYGTYTPMAVYQSARRVVEAVRDQTSTVGILPFPRNDDEQPWWPLLLAETEGAPRIIARLPFVGPGNAADPSDEALVICPVVREPAGRDRSILSIEIEDERALARISGALAKAGLVSRFITSWPQEGAPGPWLYYVELDGFIQAEDRGVARFIEALETPVARAVTLGSYGIPMDAEELAHKTAKPPRRRVSRPKEQAVRKTPQTSRKRRS
ncbi:MAG: chorismate mutase [Rhodospirillales bacterium]|nr:chorismate mutase [Rhodospirillales bacterium]